MSEVVKEEKDEESVFVIKMGKDGRVSVNITGPHVNNTKYKRLILALRKTYKLGIKNYRKQIKRDMLPAELEELPNEPTELVVNPNGTVETNIDTAAATGGSVEEVTPITKPIQKVIETKKLSLNETIAAKRERQLVETK